MTKFIGRQFSVGIGKESSRGTAVAASYWLPWETMSIDDEIKVAKNETSVNVIEAGVGQDITLKQSKCTIESVLSDASFGLILLATMGTDTVTTVDTCKSHKFTVAENATHQSLTLAVVEPNSNSGGGWSYPLSMVEELQMDFEINKYAKYKATFKGNVGATSSNTVSYTSENLFKPQDGSFKLATNLAGLAGASAIAIKKGSITIKKNTEEDAVISNVNPVDRQNKEFSVEGTIELYYNDRTMIDTYLLAGLAQAAQIQYVNSAVTIGTTTHPTITIRLAKAMFESVARKVDQKGIVSQTVKFNAYYSTSDTEMLDITLINTVASY